MNNNLMRHPFCTIVLITPNKYMEFRTLFHDGKNSWSIVGTRFNRRVDLSHAQITLVEDWEEVVVATEESSDS